MNISDLDSISDILLSDFDDFWSYNVFKSELTNENSKYIVAKHNEEIVGFAGIWIAIDEAHITNIVTKKAFRNCGIGHSLLNNLINICISENLKSITLEVNELNSNVNEFKTNYNDESLVLLVRKTVGLSKEAIDREFSKFINENELNIEQTRFINLIKNYIMKNGVIDKRILNDDPFTNYGSILQLFEGQINIIHIIIAIIDLINGNGCFKQQEN